MKYRCLVLDHDDTAVMSAETVNYPAIMERLSKTHPELRLSFKDFTRYCFRYNYTGMCRKILHLTEEEIADQFEFWRGYVRTHEPAVYEGFGEMLKRFRAEGGIVCVSSHSGIENITRDYTKNFGFVPDQIFSFELGEEKRKPAPYALREIMRIYELEPQELLMVDDMKGGCDMARSCGVPFACAGWSHNDPEIADYMRKNSDFYFASVADFTQWLFDE